MEDIVINNQEIIQILQMLNSRINHLEVMIFSSMLGILLTTTFGLYAASYKIKESDDKSMKPATLIWAVNAIYFLVSGYYYFILTHFYAATTTLFELQSKLPRYVNLSNFWNFFQLPTIPFFWLSEKSRNILSLLSAPLFPLLFSLSSIVGICYLLKRRLLISHKSIFSLLWKSLIIQLILFYLMAIFPFIRFINVIWRE